VFSARSAREPRADKAKEDWMPTWLLVLLIVLLVLAVFGGFGYTRR
jgi:hypothetical protein